MSRPPTDTSGPVKSQPWTPTVVKFPKGLVSDHQPRPTTELGVDLDSTGEVHWNRKSVVCPSSSRVKVCRTPMCPCLSEDSIGQPVRQCLGLKFLFPVSEVKN